MKPERVTTNKEDGTYCVRYYDYRYGMPKTYPLRDKDGYCVISNQYFDKLGKLEDIEEKYGLDLETVFKCGIEGIWVVCSSDAKIMQKWDVFIDLQNHRFVDIVTNSVFPFSEYGQTYALTEDELRGNPDAYCRKFPKPQWRKFLKEAEERFKGEKQ